MVLVVLVLVVVVEGVDRGGVGFWGCGSLEAESSSEPRSLCEVELVSLGMISSGSWSVGAGTCVSSFCWQCCLKCSLLVCWKLGGSFIMGQPLYSSSVFMVSVCFLRSPNEV